MLTGHLSVVVKQTDDVWESEERAQVSGLATERMMTSISSTLLWNNTTEKTLVLPIQGHILSNNGDGGYYGSPESQKTEQAFTQVNVSLSGSTHRKAITEESKLCSEGEGLLS